jgi:predicted nucleotide-binding protein
MTETATMERKSTLKLVMPRNDAVTHLGKLIEDGQGIRDQRIRVAATLDSARELKQQWNQRAVDLLTQMFGEPAIAEETMAWVGKILPEYAHFGAFVEQFQEEMDHHLSNLAKVLRLIERKPAPVTPAPGSIVEPFVVPPAPLPGAETVDRVNLDDDDEANDASNQSIAGQTVMTSEFTMPQMQSRPTSTSIPAAKGMLIMHGEETSASTALKEFAQSLGMGLACTQAAGEAHRTAIAALEEQDEFDFAVVLIESVSAGPLQGDGTAPSSGNEPAALSFELGYCVGRLGLGRVCALHPRAAKSFTDSHGILHLPVDNAGGWQLQLARHFKRAGIALDLNKLC